jgi:hypothetical protein
MSAIRAYVVAQSVHRRDVRYRYKSRAIVHAPRDVVGRDESVAMLDDAQLDAAPALELSVHDERSVVMQVVDDDVVAGAHRDAVRERVLRFGSSRRGIPLLPAQR